MFLGTDMRGLKMRGLTGSGAEEVRATMRFGRAPDTDGTDDERILLIPSEHASIKLRRPWHQRPCAGCFVMLLLCLFGLACVSLPSFESPGTITVLRVSEADVKVRDVAGWREVADDPPETARHAVTLAVRQDRDAILKALARVSDPDSPSYGKHLTRRQVAELAADQKAVAFVRAYLKKVTSALSVQTRWSPGNDYVRVEGSVGDLNRIFNADFRRWDRRVNGRTVHAAFRTREMAVPKDLERHLDGILGALHLPSGQLQHDSRGVGIDGDDKDDAADADEALNDVAMGGLLDADDIGGGSGPTGSMYSERPPLRIGKPPVRRKIDAKQWLLKEAENLAAEAGNDPFAVEAFNVATGERRGRGSGKGQKKALADPVASVGLRGDMAADERDSLIERAARYAAYADERSVDSSWAEKDAGKRLEGALSASALGSARQPRRGLKFASVAAVNRLGRDQGQFVTVQAAPSDAYGVTGLAGHRRSATAKTSGDEVQSAADDADGKTAPAPAAAPAAAAANSVVVTAKPAAPGTEPPAASKREQRAAESAGAARTSDQSSEKSEQDRLAAEAKQAAREASEKAKAQKAARDKALKTEEKQKWEDKANLMFEKMETEFKEMKTFMAEVVHRDDGDDSSSDADTTESGVASALDYGDDDVKKINVVVKKGPVDGKLDTKVASLDVSRALSGGGDSSSITEDLPGIKPEGKSSGGVSAVEVDVQDFLSEPGHYEAGYYEYSAPYEDEDSSDDDAWRFHLDDDEEIRASRANATLRHKLMLEERLKSLVTPDKVLSYYNVPRGSKVTDPRASVGVGMIAGDTRRWSATVWKYSQYFNLSLGEVNAAPRVDAFLSATTFDDEEEEEDATEEKVQADSSSKTRGGRRAGPPSKTSRKSADSIEKQVKDEVKDMVSGTVNAAVGALDSAAAAAGILTDAAPPKDSKAKLAASMSDPSLVVDTFSGAGSSFDPSTKATASLATAREIAGLESNGVADLGWHDAGARRIETNLDVQAVTSAAQGADVDILLTTHEQHYGWEPLDVLLNVAASESPQSVLSLSFGGMEKVRTLDEDGEITQPTVNPVAGGNASASAVMTDLFGSKQREAEASYVRESHSWDTYERMDTEIAKLGLRGVTVIAASGDNGPFSYGIPNPYLTWAMHDSPCTFGPSFPASMPHVTSVGGTTGGKDPFKPERAAAVELGSKISSGGGFSSIFPQPEWQKGAVGRYLEEYAYDLPPESFFNASNRAYPDVALAAEDIAIIFASIGEEPKPTPQLNTQPAKLGESGELGKIRVDLGGELAQVRHYLTESSGTSYSAPLFAGMIALINDQRLAQNKSTVGFINPVLYGLHRTAADVFRDVKEGSSKCPNPAMTGAMVGCCKHGFRTGKGWDPLTGLGSVDFSRLRDELLKLP